MNNHLLLIQFLIFIKKMKISILKIKKKLFFKFLGRLIFFLTESIYYRKIGFNIRDFTISESHYNKHISLPIYLTFLYEKQEFVIEHVKQYVNE